MKGSRPLRTDRANTHDRPALLRRQISISLRESEQFALVGATRAAKHWAKRAARLSARLDKLAR